MFSNWIFLKEWSKNFYKDSILLFTRMFEVIFWFFVIVYMLWLAKMYFFTYIYVLLILKKVGKKKNTNFVQFLILHVVFYSFIKLNRVYFLFFFWFLTRQKKSLLNRLFLRFHVEWNVFIFCCFLIHFYPILKASFRCSSTSYRPKYPRDWIVAYLDKSQKRKRRNSSMKNWKISGSSL